MEFIYKFLQKYYIFSKLNVCNIDIEVIVRLAASVLRTQKKISSRHKKIDQILSLVFFFFNFVYASYFYFNYSYFCTFNYENMCLYTTLIINIIYYYFGHINSVLNWINMYFHIIYNLQNMQTKGSSSRISLLPVMCIQKRYLCNVWKEIT